MLESLFVNRKQSQLPTLIMQSTYAMLRKNSKIMNSKTQANKQPTNKMKPKDPLKIIQQMHSDMQQAALLLSKIKTLPTFGEIFKPGESGSIEALLKQTEDRAEFTGHLLKSFETI